MSTFGKESDEHWAQERRGTVHPLPLRNGRDHLADAGSHVTTKAGRSIRLVPFDQIKLKQDDRPFLVKGLIPKEGLTIVWGPPKSGKSFVVFDLCMHVALDWEYRGRRVQQGPVVYCSFEGQGGLAGRIEAFRQRHLAEDVQAVPFYAQTMTLDLVRQVNELIAAIQAHNITPAIVTLDTLNRSLRGSENSDEDMGNYIKAADAIREAFNCGVIIIHHCGVEGTRPRGHTSLTGAADAQLACKRDRNNNVELKVEWMKDGDSEGQVITSKLDGVEIGVDADGEPITSCVVVPAEADASHQKAGPRLTANQRTMLALLKEAGKSGLTRDKWYDKAKAEGIGTSRPATLTDIRLSLQDAKQVHNYADRFYVT